jgi:hypothetical protein
MAFPPYRHALEAALADDQSEEDAVRTWEVINANLPLIVVNPYSLVQVEECVHRELTRKPFCNPVADLALLVCHYLSQLPRYSFPALILASIAGAFNSYEANPTLAFHASLIFVWLARRDVDLDETFVGSSTLASALFATLGFPQQSRLVDREEDFDDEMMDNIYTGFVSCLIICRSWEDVTNGPRATLIQENLDVLIETVGWTIDAAYQANEEDMDFRLAQVLRDVRAFVSSPKHVRFMFELVPGLCAILFQVHADAAAREEALELLLPLAMHCPKHVSPQRHRMLAYLQGVPPSDTVTRLTAVLQAMQNKPAALVAPVSLECVISTPKEANQVHVLSNGLPKTCERDDVAVRDAIARFAGVNVLSHVGDAHRSFAVVLIFRRSRLSR